MDDSTHCAYVELVAARLPLGRIGTAEAAGPAPGLAAANCRVCAGLLPGLRPCRG
jgi:hypothetical protein